MAPTVPPPPTRTSPPPVTECTDDLSVAIRSTYASRMPLSFTLELTDRGDDRVHLAASIEPSVAHAQVDGVAVQLVSRKNEPLSPRLLLPISGTLTGPMVVASELRAIDGTIPAGSRIQGTAWGPDFSVDASCPADRWTELAAHVRGEPAAGEVTRRVGLRALEGLARDRLLERLPWLGETPWRHEDEGAPFEAVAAPVTPEDVEEQLASLELSQEDADFLRELLEEEP